MSSSVFKEVTETDKLNESLVITVKKNGSIACDDNETLQNWLAGNSDTNPAISVLRETSPTPSVEEEIEAERQQKKEELKQKFLQENEEDLDEDEIEKKLRELVEQDETTKVKRVTLCLEEYIPPEQAKSFAKDVLNMAGVENPETLLHDYDYQRMTIHNDHCYTSLTMAINPRVALKKLTIGEKRVEKRPESAKKSKAQAKEQPEEKEESEGESDAERTDDTESESPEISFSEDDDEDDLDFSVNDRFGQKKLSKRQRRKIAARKARKLERQQQPQERQESEMEVTQEIESPKEVKVRKTKSPKKAVSRTNSIKEASPVVPVAVTPPTIPKKNIIIYPSAIQETSGIQKQTIGNVVIVRTQKKPANFGTQGFKTTVDRQMVGGMVVLNRKTVPIDPVPQVKVTETPAKVLEPQKVQEPTKVIVIPPKIEKNLEVATNPAPVPKKTIDPDKKIEILEDVRFTEFVPLTSEILKSKQLPAQISIQTHQSSQNLINDLIGFENPPSNPPEVPSETPSAPQSVVSGSMDLDDGLPEDLLQHVAELAEHKEIQEIIDKVQSFPDLSQLTEGADSTLNTTAEVTSTISTPSTPQSSLDISKGKTPKTLPKKTPTQVVRRSDGRVIVLPPIEAPTTRGAKRRAQGSESSPSPALNTSMSKVAKIERAGSVKDPDSRASSRRSSLAKSEKEPTASGKDSRRQSGVVVETDEMDSDATWNSEDDPDRLWCICKQPHNNRFMICCDKCEDWFHGKCVNITKAMGRAMEEKGKEWTCPNCKANKDEGIVKKSLNQQKLTKFFAKNDDKSEDEVKAAPGMCVICKTNPARSDSVYCSDECIRNHANKHMEEPKKVPLPPGLSKPSHPSHHSSSHHHHHHHSSHSSSSSSSAPQTAKKDSSASNSPADLNTSLKTAENKKFSNILKDKNNKVLVYEKTTGKVLSLSVSPTTTNLNEWLKKNPHCDIVKPGSAQAEMFAKRSEKKQVHPATPPVKDEPCLFSNPAKIHTGAAPTPPKSSTKQLPHSATSPKQQTKPQKTIGSPTKSVKSESAQKTPKEGQKLKRQSSGSSEKTSSKKQMEMERLNVKKTLKETLYQRMSEMTNPSVKKMTEDEAEDFADRIEKAMFVFFNKDTNNKYKAKYRSLKFNLGDTKNPTLIEKICCKLLSPRQLVELPASALASDELAKWREQESKHQLEIITKCELDALTQTQAHVVKTHKGEELIEAKQKVEMLEINNPIHAVNEVLSAEASSSKDRFESYINKSVSEKVSNSPLSSPSVSSSTSKKDSRRSRSRSRSRGHEHHHHHHHSKSSSKHKKRRSRSRSREHHRSKDEKRRSRSRDRKDKKVDKKDKHDSKEKKEVSSTIKKEEKPKVEEIIVKEEDCNLIDKILAETGCQLKVERPGAQAHLTIPKDEEKQQEFKVEIRDETGSPIVDKEEAIEQEIKEHPAEKLPENFLDPEPVDEHPIPIEIYSGKIYMVDVAKFDLSASVVSGSVEDIIKDIPKLLEVVGRISPKTVWDYLSKLKKIPGKEIVIIRFDSTDEENYDTLFTYLSSKERYGVIKSSTPNIKDFYLVPIESKKPLPQVLLPVDGPGFVEGDNKPDLLIGVIVKILTDLKQTSRKSVKSGKKSTSLYKHALKGAASSSTNLDSIIQMIPIKAKSPKRSKLMALPTPKVPDAATKDEDNDDTEPYSPGDSDEDFQKPLSVIKATTTPAKLPVILPPIINPESVEEKLKKIDEAIAARQAEINLLQHKNTNDVLSEPYSPGGSTMAPREENLPSSSGIFENISLPANIGDILASIKNVTTGTQKMEVDDDEYVPSSVTVSNYEYRSNTVSFPAPPAYSAITTPLIVPPVAAMVNPTTMDIDERVFPMAIPMVPTESTSSSGDSKLAKMSTEDLMKLVPDFEANKE